MTRAEQIKAGKLWMVYTQSEPDKILFEGRKTSVFEFIRQRFGMRAWKKGAVRTAQIIWEKPI